MHHFLQCSEEKNTGQVRYCLSKAITSDPKDVGLRFDRALLYCELGEYQKAAESYDQIVALYPGNIVARKMAAKVNMFLCFYGSHFYFSLW